MKSVFQLIATLACAVALTACGAAANTEKPVVLDPNTQVKELTITDTVVGTGVAAAAGDTLTVTYTGWLYDASKPGNKGTQFDATAANVGFTFPLGIGRVILGQFSKSGRDITPYRRALIVKCYGPGNPSDVLRVETACAQQPLSPEALVRIRIYQKIEELRIGAQRPLQFLLLEVVVPNT